MSPNADGTLAGFAARANHRLEEVFQRWRAQAPGSRRSPSPADLFEIVVALTMRGGKRLRPALAWYAARCIDHDLDETGVLDACLALELLQSALLIHDDIMDRDDERRGGPSVHTAMTRATGDPHLGDSLGILAGSLALAFAQRLLGECGLPDEARAAGATELACIQTEVIYGQHLDLMGGVSAATVQDLKTTSYTTRGPVRFGARLVGAAPRQITALEAYATPLGRAFQTRDDLLGTFGDARQLGKPVGADLRAGRATELVQVALERADAWQRRAIEPALGDPAASDEAVATACAAIEATGARQTLQELVRKRTAEAIAALDQTPLRPEGRQALAAIAHLLSDRVS